MHRIFMTEKPLQLYVGPAEFNAPDPDSCVYVG